jgi:hypothetical protein
MATRQIKDAKDLSTGNLIYFKGHAQATFMSDGRNVEDAINSVSDSIDTSNFPQYDNQQAITVQGINNGYGATYAIPGSDIADGGEYVDTFALKSEIPDITGLATQANLTSAVTQMTTNLAKKQDKLVSGTNIMTINSNSILGSGNFDLATTEQLRSYQPTLVSGTNIKTINSTSLLGSGNIAIKDTKNLTYSLNNSTSGTVTLLPNVCIYMPNVLTGKLAINACSTISSNNSDLIESRICFRMPNNAIMPVIQFNGVAIRWAGGNAPTFEADFTYEVSLFYPSNANSVGPMGVCVGFK